MDIKNKTFATQLRGLSPKEVRSFLELVAREVEELRRERAMLAERVDELSARLDTYERTESLLKDTLVTAQRAHNELRQSAEEHSRVILAEAEHQAKAIILRAEQQAEQLRTKLQQLEARQLNLLDQIRGLAHACLQMADTWESGICSDRSETDCGVTGPGPVANAPQPTEGKNLQHESSDSRREAPRRRPG